MFVVLAWILTAGAALALVLHVRAWRKLGESRAAHTESDFRRRQLRRRITASGLLLLLSLTLVVGSLVDWRESPRTYLWLWSLAAWLAVTVCGLALLDLWDGRSQVRDLVQQRNDARRALESELHEIRSRLATHEGESSSGKTVG